MAGDPTLRSVQPEALTGLAAASLHLLLPASRLTLKPHSWALPGSPITSGSSSTLPPRTYLGSHFSFSILNLSPALLEWNSQVQRDRRWRGEFWQDREGSSDGGISAGIEKTSRSSPLGLDGIFHDYHVLALFSEKSDVVNYS